MATGVLAGEAKVVARRSSSADTNRTKASIVSEEVTSGSQLGPSNTAQRFLAADDQNKLALILSEFKIYSIASSTQLTFLFASFVI